jgi:hypothetical protein
MVRYSSAAMVRSDIVDWDDRRDANIEAVVEPFVHDDLQSARKDDNYFQSLA